LNFLTLEVGFAIIERLYLLKYKKNPFPLFSYPFKEDFYIFLVFLCKEKKDGDREGRALEKGVS